MAEPSVATYAASLEHWHDFYLGAGGAAATLAGLLFVAISLHLRTVASKLDVQGLARVTLTDFIAVLLTALFTMIPTERPSVTGWELLALAALNFQRVVPLARTALGHGGGALSPAMLVRRFGLSIGAYVGLAIVGWLLIKGDAGNGLGWLAGVTITLLLAATRNTWDLLVTVADSDA